MEEGRETRRMLKTAAFRGQREIELLLRLQKLLSKPRTAGILYYDGKATMFLPDKEEQMSPPTPSWELLV